MSIDKKEQQIAFTPFRKKHEEEKWQKLHHSIIPEKNI